MSHHFATIVSIALSALLAAPAVALAQGELRARLRGFEEVPSVITVASGTFEGTLNAGGTSIAYTLTYANLESTVQQGHIHVGQKGVNGAIVIWLCQNPGAGFTDPTGLAPTCAQGSGTVTGTVTSANVIVGGTQGIAAGEFADVVTAIRRGVAYVNVHTADTPTGRIRGQIRSLP